MLSAWSLVHLRRIHMYGTDNYFMNYGQLAGSLDFAMFDPGTGHFGWTDWCLGGSELFTIIHINESKDA